jgi:hypothetical protein
MAIHVADLQFDLVDRGIGRHALGLAWEGRHCRVWLGRAARQESRQRERLKHEELEEHEGKNE